MKLGVLFSGGKDSTLALHMAAEKEQVTCLITLWSKNPESYMFHTPNIDLTAMQAQALNLPLVVKATEGKKEEELQIWRRRFLRPCESFTLRALLRGQLNRFIRRNGFSAFAIAWVYGVLTRFGRRIRKLCWKSFWRNGFK